MEWTISHGEIAREPGDALLVPIGDGGTLTPVAMAVDAAMGGRLAGLVSDLDFKGKAFVTRAVYSFGQTPTRFLILVGIGGAHADNLDNLRQSVAAGARSARDAGATSLVVALPGVVDPTAAAQALVEGVLLGCFKDTRYKSNGAASRQLTSLRLVTTAEQEPAAREGIARGTMVAEGVILARELVNQPGAELWPDRLAQVTAAMAAAQGLGCTIYGEHALADLGAGALLAVGHGSDRPPRLVHLRYRPVGRENEAPITFIGKGITFDTGGYSIKTAGGMETMKSDMAGAAAVIGAMAAVARLKPDIAIDAVIASAENMVSGRAMRPGDVLRSMSGKTIEVNNTDAEGRLVLADALTFAQRQGAREMIDLATLTGACVVALGHVAVGVMGNQQPIVDRLLAAAATEGERMWQLPLYDEYREGLRSEIADMRNSGGRYAGAQVGASFIKEFAGETPWVHLDIAGPSWVDKDSPLAVKGATGVGVRTLIRYAFNAAQAEPRANP